MILKEFYSISILSYNRIPLLINNLENLVKGIEQQNLLDEICIEIYDNCSEESLLNQLENFIFESKLKVNLIKLYKNSYNKGYANKEEILIDLSKKEIEYLNAIKELWLHIN